MENTVPNSDYTSINILQELLQKNLFKRNYIQQYQTYIFRHQEDLFVLLYDVIDMLHDFMQIDENGSCLTNYDRKLIKKYAAELIDLDNALVNQIEELENRNFVYKDYQFEEFKGNLSMILHSFYELLRNGLNTSLIKKMVPDRSKISEYRINIEKGSAETKVFVDKAKKLVDEAQLVVDNLAALPTKQEVSSYSKMFGNESQIFKNAAKWWIIGVFGCLVGIVVASVYYSTIVSDAEFTKYTVNQIIQFNLTKVLTISALLYGLAICNKNYKSSKHNQILNKHRENALASFQAFQVSAADKETKNAVLLEATRTIFGAQQTGYVATETDDSPNKIIEIIKTIQEKG